MTKRENIIGRELFEVFPDNPGDESATGVSNLRTSLQSVIEHKTPSVMAIQKYDVRREDGSFEEKHWSPLNSPVLDEKGQLQYIIHNVVDVTDFVKLKRLGLAQHEENTQLRESAEKLERLRQAQKLEALGRLVGGIAHDFNTILMLIMAYCESGVAAAGLPQSHEDRLAQIFRASEQAASLIKQLMTFSRSQPLGLKVVNLNTIFSNLYPILSKAVPGNIRFEKKLAENLGNMQAEPGQIEQIVMNLTINAIHAMPRGGNLRIETANVTLDETKAQGTPPCEPGAYIMLSVTDTGTGMSAETQARIFEPFYTTKAEGKGTGLGLATVYGIVSRSKGTIWLYSRLGEGTKFELYFPISDQNVAEVDEKPATVPKLTGSETILIAEDTTELRKIFTKIFSASGYRVIEAADGLQALNMYSDYGNPVDLIITDGVMPNMSGLEFAGRVREKNPQQKIIFLSGYSKELLDEHRIEKEKALFLEKPIGLNTLLSNVRAILDEKKE